MDNENDRNAPARNESQLNLPLEKSTIPYKETARAHLQRALDDVEALKGELTSAITVKSANDSRWYVMYARRHFDKIGESLDSFEKLVVKE